jgi:hypothetical protein
MAQTFLDVVIEELRRAGVRSATFHEAGDWTGDEPILAVLQYGHAPATAAPTAPS